MLNESGQFRGQSGHARTSAEHKNICRFLVSGAAAAEAYLFLRISDLSKTWFFRNI